MPSTLGTPARTYVLKTEGDKISLEFAASSAVLKGQPVKLAGGTSSAIVPWVGGTDDINLCIGHADKTITAAMITTGGSGPSGPLVTVVCRGYAVVYGVTTHTATTLAAGPCTTVGASTTSGFTDYCQYAASAAASGYPDMVGWVLDYSASGIDKVIRILLRD